MVEGLERRPLGHRVQGPPLHGRRRLRHGSALGDAGLPTRPSQHPRADDWRPERQPPSVRARCPSALADARRSPYEQVRAAPRLGSRPAPSSASWRVDGVRGLRSLGGVRAAAPRTRRSTGRSARTAAGPGRRADLSRHQARPQGRSAARSTTSCSPRSPAASASCCSRGRVGRPGRAHARARVGAHAAAGAAATYNNRVSAMFAELPVGIDDPLGAPRSAIAAQMDGLKESKQAVAGEVLDVAVRLRAADAARRRRPGSPPACAAAQRQHGHHERARPAGPAVRGRAPDARGVSRTCRSPARSASAWRSSPTTAGQLRRDRRLRHAPDIGLLCEGIERSMAELREGRGAPGTTQSSGLGRSGTGSPAIAITYPCQPGAPQAVGLARASEHPPKPAAPILPGVLAADHCIEPLEAALQISLVDRRVAARARGLRGLSARLLSQAPARLVKALFPVTLQVHTQRLPERRGPKQ